MPGATPRTGTIEALVASCAWATPASAQAAKSACLAPSTTAMPACSCGRPLPPRDSIVAPPMSRTSAGGSRLSCSQNRTPSPVPSRSKSLATSPRGWLSVTSQYAAGFERGGIFPSGSGSRIAWRMTALTKPLARARPDSRSRRVWRTASLTRAWSGTRSISRNCAAATSRISRTRPSICGVGRLLQAPTSVSSSPQVLHHARHEVLGQRPVPRVLGRDGGLPLERLLRQAGQLLVVERQYGIIPRVHRER